MDCLTSPFESKVTFDITEDRNAAVRRAVKELREWTDNIANVDDSEAFALINRNFCDLITTTTKTSVEKEFECVEAGSNGEVPISIMTQVHCVDGFRHGFYRVFKAPPGTNEHVEFVRVGRYSNGKSVGTVWKRLKGGGYLIGKEYSTNGAKGSGDQEMLYLYPGLTCGYSGIWRDGRMVVAKFGRVGPLLSSEFGMPVPHLDFPSLESDLYRYDPSTSLRISATPQVRDPYELQTVYVAQSRTSPLAGEGLFSKRFLPDGALVSLFNGVRRRDTPLPLKAQPDEFSEYRIALNSGTFLDIPDQSTDTSKYSATLGHKCCHSFDPNAVFAEFEHPRFGRIMSVFALRDIQAGDEVLVSYNYRMCHAPLWYVRSWFDHLKFNKGLGEEEMLQMARKESRFSGANILMISSATQSSCDFCNRQICMDHSFKFCSICGAKSFHSGCWRTDRAARGGTPQRVGDQPDLPICRGCCDQRQE